MGMLIKKIQCHVACVTNQPPTIGPNTGPISPAIAMAFHAATNWVLGTFRMIVKRATGIINAPPMPCKIRDQIKAFREFAMAQATDPNTKIPTAARKTFNVPYLSAIQPVSGMNKATVSE